MVTHIAYTALHEKPELVAGWSSKEQIEINNAMLRNVVEPIVRTASNFQHISILQGTKIYGVHLRSIPIPARERDASKDHENFFFDHEDYVRERGAQHGFSCTALRPQLVTGPTPGALNVLPAIGVYAAIRREKGEPFGFPGGPSFVWEAADADVAVSDVERFVRRLGRLRSPDHHVCDAGHTLRHSNTSPWLKPSVSNPGRTCQRAWQRIYVRFFAVLLILMTLLGAGLFGLASGLQHGTDRRCSAAYCCSAAYSANLTRSLPLWRYVQSILESDSMNNALKRPFFRQIERWLVSLVMAAMAYVIEKALLGSIRRGEAKPRPHAQSSAETIFSAGAERRRSAQR
jgi:hypothetical protein